MDSVLNTWTYKTKDLNEGKIRGRTRQSYKRLIQTSILLEKN